MQRLWTRREIDAPASAVWELLTDPDQWPRWGPSVRDARVDGGRIELGATGKVRTALGIELPFEITDFEPGRRWAWKVAGRTATDHSVEPRGSDRCAVGFGVPWPAAPYLVVCRVALRRLTALVPSSEVS